jgi:LytS/YehU family sensor histidine kinase
VGEELELSRSYLAVEALRFGSRLEVEEDLDERGNRCLLPPLLLQPLVENAVRHGIATRVEGGTLRLGIACGGGRLRILIENPFDPESPARPGSGRGIENVRKRLFARYGEEGLFAAKRLADRYLVVISVPAEMPA